MNTRRLLLNAALAASALSAALLGSTVFAPRLYAEFVGCIAICADGSSCSPLPNTVGNCTCACNYYLFPQARCSCTELKPLVPG